jgi:hypothetical protein
MWQRKADYLLLPAYYYCNWYHSGIIHSKEQESI